MVHGGKGGKQCCPVYYWIYNLEIIQNLLTDCWFFYNRVDVKGRSVLVFHQMFRNIHRIIAHTYYRHKDVFIKDEEKYRLYERYLLFCKKFNILNKNDFLIK
jgi:hypothetical protein